MSSFDAFTSDTRPISTLMAPDTAGTSCDEQKDAVQVTGNVDQNSIFAEAVESHQNSPKKKRYSSTLSTLCRGFYLPCHDVRYLT